jgi:hypothetical protein
VATALSLKMTAVLTTLTTMKKFSAWAQSAVLGHLGRSPSSAIGKDKIPRRNKDNNPKIYLCVLIKIYPHFELAAVYHSDSAPPLFPKRDGVKNHATSHYVC